jgi:hypothetical protein
MFNIELDNNSNVPLLTTNTYSIHAVFCSRCPLSPSVFKCECDYPVEVDFAI